MKINGSSQNDLPQDNSFQVPGQKEAISQQGQPEINLSPAIVQSKIHKLDVSGFKNSRERFLEKAKRFLNFIQAIGGFFNAHTIMTGASKQWDRERLSVGKHALLAKVGAEHVQLTSRTVCKVDGHFLNAATFIQRLEEMGGKRSLVEFEVQDPSFYSGKKCHLEIDGEFPIEMQEIVLTEEQQVRSKYGVLLIEEHIAQTVGQNIRIVKNPETGKYYALNQESFSRLSSLEGVDFKGNFKKGAIKESSQTTSLLPEKKDFPIIKFEKNSSQWKEALKMLEEMKIEKTPWTTIEKDDALYLVPIQHRGKLELGIEKKGCVLKEKPASLSAESDERGTVLLTMNQSDVYEQYPHEMLTFLLEGLNVMVYNNPGKGLSTGAADRENINASIEASYQYLKSKGISDEKILAKGQCFGGAPTAWLGREHPNINIMLDQNPANFYDVAMKRVNDVAESLMAEERNAFTKWIGKMLKDNFIINGIAKAALGGYDVAGDLAYNKGHKLLNINPPDAKGIGGDQLVPTHHPEMMIDAIQDNPGKVTTLSMNPGASHVTDWWVGYESQDTVIQFLHRTELSQSLF